MHVLASVILTCTVAIYTLYIQPITNIRMTKVKRKFESRICTIIILIQLHDNQMYIFIAQILFIHSPISFLNPRHHSVYALACVAQARSIQVIIVIN